jgi:hypothetical protein
MKKTIAFLLVIDIISILGGFTSSGLTVKAQGESRAIRRMGGGGFTKGEDKNLSTAWSRWWWVWNKHCKK